MDESQIGSYSLDALVDTYDIDNIYEQYKRLEFLEKLSRYVNLSQSKVVEFGSATGQMTKLLSTVAQAVVAVDGSGEFIAIAKKKVADAANVTFYRSYFEEFSLAEKFDCLIMHHVLEHIENPLLLLAKAKDLLAEDGVVAFSVPYAQALSRQLAVKMGLLSSVHELTDNDKRHGHYRVYDWSLLEGQVKESGYQIVGRHGLSFKLFADKQNVAMLEREIIGPGQIKGLWLLGDEMPEVAGAIMIVAKKTTP